MLSFLTELWNNIFESGATPALVKATHAAFSGLLITILIMLYVTGSFHFVALLVLSLGLWAAVTWFISEYNKFLADQATKNSGEKGAATAKETKAVPTGAGVQEAQNNSKATTKKTTAKKRRV